LTGTVGCQYGHQQPAGWFFFSAFGAALFFAWAP
jgi:hypothetical protein